VARIDAAASGDAAARAALRRCASADRSASVASEEADARAAALLRESRVLALLLSLNNQNLMLHLQ
jgi:hypothetical protein